jgi:cytochrome c1
MKKDINQFVRFGFISAILLICVTFGCTPKKGSLVDNAGGRKPEDFPELATDVFKPMDGGIELKVDEIKGRNTWNLWCAGDEQFWERMSRESYGLIDLLKTVDSRNRTNRFQTLGLINEPGFRPASKPDQYGLWIDEPIEGQGEPAGIDPKVYGHPTGIMGFRLFENPDFKGDAVKNWDGERYYKDPDYAVSPDLVRPYKVGISCGSCHIAFNPCKPPADPENPKWENLASAIANQYIREGAVFAHNVKPGGLFWEMLKTQPPGTSDTSRIATDHINNPNTINPIFELGARLSVAEPEEITGDSLNLPGVTAKMDVPHVLKDGADSVGVPGATLRVYINIGSYSQHWLQQHNALIGLSPQKPFSVKTAQENSVYWLATQTKFTNVANFFKQLKSYRLEDAPGGKDYITKDEAVMTRGKLVFAENCASCHSSKRPKDGEDETEFFRKAVMQPDFRDNNFFSDDHRYPVTKIKSNASRALGTNAKRGHIWAAFSSETYKNLPSVGDIEVTNPHSGAMEKFTMPDGGPGYYRTASLISCWSSAPFLHNNSLGEFTGDPSVKGRMTAFNDAAEKLLWPEKRSNIIWRTSQECNLQIQAAVLPALLRLDLKAKHLIDPDGYFRIGPIPEGTPINLLANVDPEAGKTDLLALCIKLKTALAKIKVENLDAAAAKELLRTEVAPELWKVSKCPDFVEDRGHYFGSELPDADKLALIEYLKTL